MWGAQSGGRNGAPPTATFIKHDNEDPSQWEGRRGGGGEATRIQKRERNSSMFPGDAIININIKENLQLIEGSRSLQESTFNLPNEQSHIPATSKNK